MNLRALAIFWLALLLLRVAVATGAVIYVDNDSPGGNGSSWEAALRYLQDALATADENDEIRVAQGTYVPDQNSANPEGSGDRYATFGLISGVSILGGYAGYGQADPDVRDVREYETILSGDLRRNDFLETVPAQYATEHSRADNSCNVLTTNDTDRTAVLDGFTIAGGQADGGSQYGSGAGMHNWLGSPTVVDCTFTRNWARNRGGAIRNDGGCSPVFVRCRFLGNAANSRGGAVSHYREGRAEFINCIFSGNISFYGDGGAIHARDSVILTNCTFSGNTAVNGGGITIPREASILTNCIFWGNSDSSGMGESAQIYAFSDVNGVNFCCVQGWTGDLGGVGNTGDDPLIADADGADNLFGTADDNPRLLPGSAALNAGDNDSVPNDLISDLDGNPRIAEGGVDLGAYEGVTQAILLTTESLTIPEGGTGSFGVYLAMAPEASVEIAVAFESGDADISVSDGTSFVFNSDNYSTPKTVSVSAAEDAGYLHETALILAEGGNLRPAGVTVHEQDNEPTTGIIYVDDDATGPGDGMTWDRAYRNLQDALHAAFWHPQVWEIRVGQGIYRPDEGRGIGPGDRKMSFGLVNGVTIKGGYAGLGSPDPHTRDVKLYEAILSGDLSGDDDGFANNDDNSYCVVLSNGTDETGILDGFTITGGNAENDRGGGMWSHAGCPTVIDCNFVGNWAAGNGGGMYNVESGPLLTGCTFSGNFSGADGGGIYNHHTGSVLTNCTIVNNVALRNGGGIGADELYLADMELVNCTILGNEAGNQGGGIYNWGSDFFLTNCILWDNIAYEGPQMAVLGSAFMHHNCVQGGRLDVFGDWWSDIDWGEGNTDADPCFADASVGDYHLKSRAGRWDANDGRWTMDAVTSPCVDAGDPNSDWTAELWPHGKRVNMGAFGGTAEASMSESLLGNKADLDNNDSVDFRDFAGLGESFLGGGPLRLQDLNRDGIVNFVDILEFAREWLWQGV